mmetsp:Transcript_19655/g.16796  ORF Transcript_19655/g.16796 Transcript_19655/m.16796 type:complete len:86 (-) Transcript_19655:501-758(-)
MGCCASTNQTSKPTHTPEKNSHTYAEETKTQSHDKQSQKNKQKNNQQKKRKKLVANLDTPIVKYILSQNSPNPAEMPQELINRKK